MITIIFLLFVEKMEKGDIIRSIFLLKKGEYEMPKG